MKKQALFDLASMPKMVLIIVMIVMLGTLFGATSYLLKMPTTNLSFVVNPIIEAQCEIDSDCELVYVGQDVCPPCDALSEEYQCLNKNEAKKVRDEWINKFNTDLYIVCSPCEVEFDRYVCECVNGKCEKVKEELVEEVSITTDKMEYEQGEEVKITINNNSDKEQRISYPAYSIERFESNNWIEIKQIWCPCGAYCEEVEWLFIKPKDKLEYEWNQQESWCGRVELLWGDFSHQVQSGRYRIKSMKIGLPDPENYKTIYSNEFTIKEKSALDLRCGEKVKGIGLCEGLGIGYEFNSETGKCIKRGVSGCSFDIPFETLEECQEVCEENNIRGGTNESKCKELGGFVTCDSTPEETELDCLCCFENYPDDCRYVK
ncbi:hypothetical protein KAI56_04240 [Candidatus Parcubacteria bacterium]|nr:hypothetical protein [Candidatus Parcubacteria bacterium]